MFFLFLYVPLSITSSGSLAAFVPTQRGMVVCADRREYNRVSGASDTTLKVRKLGPRAAFVVTGANGILDPTAHHYLFSMQVAISQFFSTKNINSGHVEKHLDAFRKYLSARYLAVGVPFESTRQGSPSLCRMACQCAWAAARTKNTYLSSQFRRLAARRGKKRAIIAVAHTIIVIGYHLQKNQSNYEDLGGNYFDRIHSDGLKRYLAKRLQQLGHKVTLEPMEAA